MKTKNKARVVQDNESKSKTLLLAAKKSINTGLIIIWLTENQLIPVRVRKNSKHFSDLGPVYTRHWGKQEVVHKKLTVEQFAALAVATVPFDEKLIFSLGTESLNRTAL